MGVLLKTSHLKRYKDIAYLLLKYGQIDIMKGSGIQGLPFVEQGHEFLRVVGGSNKGSMFAPMPAGPKAAEAEELAADVEKLGPAFVKLGKLLATRADLLPLPY